MMIRRGRLEAEFLRLCLLRGPEWVESVIRPLRLSGAVVTPRDIPYAALTAIVTMFGRVRRPTPGIAVV
jgi:hypothetical protein